MDHDVNVIERAGAEPALDLVAQHAAFFLGILEALGIERQHHALDTDQSTGRRLQRGVRGHVHDALVERPDGAV
jgi:hypothetical protein